MISEKEVVFNAIRKITDDRYDSEYLFAVFGECYREIEKLTKQLALKGICEICEEKANKKNMELRKEERVFDVAMKIMKSNTYGKYWFLDEAIEQARRDVGE